MVYAERAPRRQQFHAGHQPCNNQQELYVNHLGADIQNKQSNNNKKRAM